MEKKREKPILERWHGAHHYSNKVHLLFLFVLFFSAAILAWSYVEINKIQDLENAKLTAPAPSQFPSPTPEQVFCTMEAKLCPDGVTYVGRSGPKCEFSPCPGHPNQ